MSLRGDSNPQPAAYKAAALPLSYPGLLAVSGRLSRNDYILAAPGLAPEIFERTEHFGREPVRDAGAEGDIGGPGNGRQLV
jgi:hypothetical protein